MKNRINVYGVIMSSEWDDMRAWYSPFSATFPVQIAEALAEADPAHDLELHIDSPGGYVTGGKSMITLIQEWCELNNRKCNVTVGGMAASMAAVMMIAFNGTVTVRDCSTVMFHAAKTSMWDDVTAEELRDAASELDLYNRYITKMIARRTGMTEEAAAELIAGRKESFFGAEELIEAKLADAVIGAPEAPVKLPSAMAMKAFARRMSAGNDIGGYLAAVALSTAGMSKNKGATMPESLNDQAASDVERDGEEVVTPSGEATAEETTETTETPAEEVQPTETETESEETETESEETTETESEETETETETEPKESQEVTDLRAAVARAEAAEKAAIARAEAAEKALNDSRVKTVSAALAPAAVNTATGKNAGTAWREAVAACGGNTAAAKAKHPELFAAIIK